ncbi:MAG: bifunctional UDP-N-acetylglucosamine diphosphorylase/glucosamine-1-phosphate N-acetyltransferase GlmU [Oligoflexia bacterium]|nr:bifunctional UDP-N-acetylglucosamine diphosphorylase/glucosamine-1-phosphate N-acetyltransferase GlmU [Oligoflexia bacterium]
MKTKISAVILAAGEGKRLKIREVKALAPILGQRMIDYPIEEFKKFVHKRSLDWDVGIVIGHRRDEVREYLEKKYSDSIFLAIQEQQLGTADAINSYFKAYNERFVKHSDKHSDYTLVICADTPLIRAEDMDYLFSQIIESSNEIVAVAATFLAANPLGYGRIVRGNVNGFHIVEEKDLDNSTREIKEVNSGFYIFKTSYLIQALSEIKNNNNAGEFYLTDAFEDSAAVKAVLFNNGNKFLGVNTLEQLEEIEKIFRREKISSLREEGVRFVDADSVFIDYAVKIGRNSLVYPGVVLEGECNIGERVVLESGSVIRQTIIENDVVIKAYTYIEDSIIKSKAQIGPFAHLRPASDIGENVKVGNFVEVKKSILRKGVKVSHLSYVGDAEVGEESNVGCGFITCNYDGKKKHKTTIGKNVFIGSDCQAVAPVEIASNSFVAAGSTITENIPEGGFAIARSRQVTKPGMAKRFLATEKK